MASLKFKHPAGATYALFDEIDLTDRGREDYGDIDALQASIREFGLIQLPMAIPLDPPVNGKKYRLLTGGRRTHAINLMGSSHIPLALRRDAIAKDQQFLIELEENLQRKEMTWQEMAKLIHKSHLHFKANGGKSDSAWGHKQTGALFGVSSTHASHAVHVATCLMTGDEEINRASSINEAYSILLRRKEQELDADLSRKYRGARPTINVSAPLANGSSPSPVTVIDNDLEGELDRILGSQSTPTASNDTLAEYPISSWCTQGDSCMGAEPVLDTWEAESVDHIITDPPYGIDVDDETLVNAAEIKATHDRAENIAMFPAMFHKCFRVLRDRGYAIFFMDIEHRELLEGLATAAGFSVQKTPFHWVKTHRCKNLAGATNFTNNVEHALICRKGTATLENKGALNYIIANGEIERRMYSNPFAKPYEVWKHLIEAVSRPKQIIADPFAGQMSCPRACLHLNREFRAVEFEPHHYNKGLLILEKAIKEIAGSNAKIS